MKTNFRVYLVVFISFLLASCSRTISGPVTHTTCKLNLQAIVRQGPNANLNITGLVTIEQNIVSAPESNSNPLDAESYTILLVTTGRSIQFVIYTDRGNIYGSGIMENGQQTCSGVGGGVLSGPAFGDMGDWRGEWLSESFTTMEEQTRTTSISPLWICAGALSVFIIIFIVTLFIRALTPYKSKNPFKADRSEKSKISTETVKRMDQGNKPFLPGKEQPLAEYQITYSADDQLFDLSFEINKSSRYAGDFGVSVAKWMDANKSQATALEVWLFDARNAQTRSVILISEFCNSQPILRAEMEQKGQVEMLQTGAIINLSTNEIIVKTQVLHVDYDPVASDANSIFKKVTLNISAWN